MIVLMNPFGYPAVARAGQDSELARLVLTSKENGLEDQTEFYCSGTIHGYVRMPGPIVGQHTLEGIWTGADRKVKDHSRVSINYPAPGESMAYLWLAFSSQSLLGGLNPAGDQERLSYNGPWQLEARLDEKTILKKTFTVHCN